MDRTTDERLVQRDDDAETNEKRPTSSRLRKRRDRHRKNRKPSRPANHIGQRSNRRLKRL